MKTFVPACLAVALLFGAATAERRLLQAAPAPGPGSCQTVYQVAQSAGLTTLVQALNEDNLQPYLNSPTLGYTVFAPTNAAFQNAFETLDTNLTDILYSGHLDALLQYHFLLKPYTAAQLVTMGSANSNSDNETLSFSMMGSGVMVTSYADEAMITQANIKACDSIVHVVDHVLLPNFAAEGLSASL